MPPAPSLSGGGVPHGPPLLYLNLNVPIALQGRTHFASLENILNDLFLGNDNMSFRKVTKLRHGRSAKTDNYITLCMEKDRKCQYSPLGSNYDTLEGSE
jgi:hypothetical protein